MTSYAVNLACGERAGGALLYDRDGSRYADFLAGFGVFGVGRNHPVVRGSSSCRRRG